MKALKAEMHIACTGTPVENRLLDLWNICDALQPGLLSSAREFVQRFEKRQGGGNQESSLLELKKVLLFAPRAMLKIFYNRACLLGYILEGPLPLWQKIFLFSSIPLAAPQTTQGKVRIHARYPESRFGFMPVPHRPTPAGSFSKRSNCAASSSSMCGWAYRAPIASPSALSGRAPGWREGPDR